MAAPKNACPPATLTALKGHGATDAELANLGALPGIDWAALLALVGKYGPGIIADLMAVFAAAP